MRAGPSPEQGAQGLPAPACLPAYICLPVCLTVSLSVCLPVCLFVWLSVCLPVQQPFSGPIARSVAAYLNNGCVIACLPMLPAALCCVSVA